jgi:hypothetical protein
VVQGLEIRPNKANEVNRSEDARRRGYVNTKAGDFEIKRAFGNFVNEKIRVWFGLKKTEFKPANPESLNSFVPQLKQ